jgi:L-lactate dehydrogenase
MTKKISIIGAGAVGSTTAFTLATKGIATEIVLIDINEAKVKAEALDILHGSLFYPTVDIIGTSDNQATKDSDVVIVTAGAKQNPGETRLDLASKTIKLMESILPPLAKLSPNAKFLMVTNPVDIITFVSQKLTGFNSNQLFGSGTVLDSSRLRYLIASKASVAVQNVHAFIVGEHGDSEIPLWSSASISGVSLDNWEEFGVKPYDKDTKNEIYEEVKNGAYTVIEGKGATNYAIALSTYHIIKSIFQNSNTILPLSTNVERVFGLPNVCLSLPSIVNSKTIDNRLNFQLSESEMKGLLASGDQLRKVLDKFGY